MSLSILERKALAETWMREGRGKMTRVIVHCGAGNLVDTRELVRFTHTFGLQR